MSQPDPRPEQRRDAVSRLARLVDGVLSARAQMLLMLLVVGAVGAGSSFVLLRAGLERMWLRYPIAACVAYAAFLGLLHLWAQWQIGNPELSTQLAALPDEGKERRRRIWDLLDVPMEALRFIDLDDWRAALLLIAVSIVLVVLFGAVVFAPVLLAEVLLDALLVAGLWKRFDRHKASDGSWAALRATHVPAAIVIVALGGIGFVLQSIEPSARSIGEFFRITFG
jgi:hypothetical protein